MEYEEITVLEQTQVIEETVIENEIIENVLFDEEIGSIEDGGIKDNNGGTEENGDDINDKGGIVEEYRSTEERETKDNNKIEAENVENIDEKVEHNEVTGENNGGAEENNGGAEEIAQTELKVYTDEELTCNICLITFKTKKYIDIHNDIIHESFHGMCPAVGCKLSFITRTELKSHVKIKHKETKEFKCRDCTEKMTSFKMFVDHETRHYRPFAARKEQAMCDICSNVMMRQHLTRHKKMVHGIRSNLYYKRKHVKSEL